MQASDSADSPTTRGTPVAVLGDHERRESRRTLSALCEACGRPSARSTL